MKLYTTYLENKHLSKSTVSRYVQIAEWLLLYVQRPPQEITYQDLLGYINYLKRQGKKANTINHQLGALNHYFGYLQSSGIRDDNPAAHLRVQLKRGVRQLGSWLTFEELESVYQRYVQAYPDAVDKQLLLSLLIYQGLTKGDLSVLEIQGIDLMEGKITIPANGRRNGRVLDLHFRQSLLLSGYVAGRSGLLFAFSGRHSLMNHLHLLYTQLQSLHYNIQNGRHVRGSVIAHWLKTEDLRIVQYKAGHRYVSSTERYQVAHLEELKAEISQVHPLSKKPS